MENNNQNLPTIILLAHQDDEIAIMPLIMQSLNTINAHVVFLTSGTRDGSASRQRNLESLRNLGCLGILEDNIHFVGSLLAIGDKTLSQHLELVYQPVVDLIFKHSIKSIYTMAWEGGHPDHDATHLLGVVIAYRHGMLSQCQQLPWYNGALATTLKPVNLFSPLPANGYQRAISVNWRNRCKWLLLALRYPSQWKVLVWLYPLLLKFVLASGRIVIQPCSVLRIKERPTAKILRYEQHNFYQYRQFELDVAEFLQSNLPESLND